MTNSCRIVICLILISCVASFHTSRFLNYHTRSSISTSSSSFSNSRLSSNTPPSGPPGGGRGRTGLYNAFGNGQENSTDDGKIETEESGTSDNIVVEQWKSLPSESREDIRTIGASFLFALVVRLFLIEPRFIPSLSMFPTFEVGDQLLVDKITHVQRPYSRRDVVVFNPSQTYIDLTGNQEALIKRVVAVAGDTVEVKNHRLFVNGVEQDEPFTNEQPDYELSPRTVPAGMLLVLGDNRNHSFDSHVWGFLPEKNVIGRAVVKYWPPWRVGFVEGSQ